jgi:hypothetical protein
MGFIRNIFNRWFGHSPTVRELPSGSVTVDLEGSIVTSTVSSSFPQSTLQQVGQDVVALFREARAAQMPLAEVSLQFGSLLITARELRGGAVIFLFPQTALMPSMNENRL